MKNKSEIAWLSSVIGAKKISILILLVLNVLLGGSGVLFASLLGNTIDYAASGNKDKFIFSAGTIIALILIQLTLRAILRHVHEYAYVTYENTMKERLFGKLLAKDYASVTATHSAEWLNRLTSDTVVCAGAITDILPGLAGMLVKMIAALSMIVVIEPFFAYLLVPGGVLMLGLTYLFRKKLKSLHRNVQESDGKLRIFLSEYLSNLIIVRSFSVQSQSKSEAAEKTKEYKNARMKKNIFSNICNIGFSLVMNSLYLVGLIYGGMGIVNGNITYGTLTEILQLIGQVQTPVANITGYLPRYYSMCASAARLMEAENFPEEETEQPYPDIHEFYRFHFKALGFCNAAFTYLPPDNSDDRAVPVVFKDVNFSISKGEYVALIGPSGAGKSTLLKLMLALYPLDVGEGYILSDEEQLPLNGSWHRLFAYLPQGNALMSGTIREIVAFSDKSRKNEDEAIYRALQIACADEFVSKLDMGIDTEVGEDGLGLSEGQLQRIGLARAIFSEAPILLLDESTSALDEVTERRLLNNLRELTDKTVIIVTHRPNVFQICDKIITVTREGTVTESENDKL